MDAGWRRVARRIRVPIGFAFAVLYLWLARPTPASMLASLLLVAPGLWLRAYASGYVKKNVELATSGPYAYTRNPLYLGSMSLAFGFAAASRSLAIVIALALLFVIIYVPTIRSEEEYLRTQFSAFDAYARSVPRLVPWRLLTGMQRSARHHAGGAFAPALYRKHREYNALMGAAGIYVALALKLHLRR